MPDTSVLPDVLGRNLALVFCGTGAGRKSAEVGAYYAKPGNRFWPTLHEIGLTPTLFDPRQFADVLKLGIGLTDIAKQHIGQDHEIDLAGVDAAGLSRKIRHFAPGILAFTSKKAASLFFAKPTGLIGYGLQSEYHRRDPHLRVDLAFRPGAKVLGHHAVARTGGRGR